MKENLLSRASGGRFFCTENGRRCGLTYAFSCGCMLGLHLSLPRALAAHDVRAHLHSDGGVCLEIPLTLAKTSIGEEEYAALFDSTALPRAERLFFLSLTLSSPCGRLYVHFGAGERVSFRPAPALPLSLFFSGEDACEGQGGVYVMPYTVLEKTGALCRGVDGDYDRFFSHLSAHGVRTLLLSLPDGDKGVCRQGLSLPPAAAIAAGEQGIVCLFDLFPFLSLHNPACAANEIAPRLCDAAGTFHPMETLSLDPASLCGEGGILSLALAGGYGGVFLRYADRFGDSFLCALRGALAAHGASVPVLVCSFCDGKDVIAFGRRRRFYEGGADARLSYTLRDALLLYLSAGETEPLSRYLCFTLPAMPRGGRLRAVHPLSGDGGESFLSLLGEAGGSFWDPASLGALAELGELIAATLPGIPVLPCERAGEQTLAFRLRLFGLRRKERALVDGEFRLHELRRDRLVFSRARQGEMLLTVINRSPDVLSLSSEDGFSVLFGGRGRKLLYRLSPYSGTVLRISLFQGEQGALRLVRQPILTRDTRFAPRVVSTQEKSS